MNVLEAVRLALDTIRVQKLKSAFTLAGVTIAVMFLIAVVSIVEGMSKYVEEDFVNYYSENPNASFAGMVWTNNAWIAAQAVAFGVTGLWVPYILFMNAQGVGMAGGMMAAYDRLDVFFLYILPHGLMELTAIFIAAAAGTTA